MDRVRLAGELRAERFVGPRAQRREWGGELARPLPLPLHRRPRRPRQVHARRPHPGAHRRGRPPRHAGPVPRLDGPRARARHHDQGPERAPRLEGPRPPPDRHARATSTSGTRCRAAWPRAKARVLLVDASQGIEAQTLANCYLALEHDLAIVAALNKIDLPAAEPDRVAGEIERVLGIPADEILRISAKTGEGVPELLDAIVEHVPAAEGRPRRAAAGADVRLVLRPVPRRRERGARVRRHAHQRRQAALRPGERDPRRRGDRRAPAGAHAGGAASGPARSATSSPASRTSARRASARPSPPRRGPRRALEGYRDPKPMVFCGLYPVDGDEYADLREALEKLRLNDSSFTYEPETSGALGFGFRCGFLGLLHMEIVRERLEREYDLSLVATAPNVEYRVELVDGARRGRRQPVGDARLEQGRSRSRSRTSTSPCSRRPSTSGRSWSSRSRRRGEMQRMEYLSEERVELVYAMPLGEIVMDFFDQLKSRTRGYASLDYEPAGYRVVEPGRRSTCCSTTCRSTRSPRSCTATRRTTTAAA